MYRKRSRLSYDFLTNCAYTGLLGGYSFTALIAETRLRITSWTSGGSVSGVFDSSCISFIITQVPCSVKNFGKTALTVTDSTTRNTVIKIHYRISACTPDALIPYCLTPLRIFSTREITSPLYNVVLRRSPGAI